MLRDLRLWFDLAVWWALLFFWFKLTITAPPWWQPTTLFILLLILAVWNWWRGVSPYGLLIVAFLASLNWFLLYRINPTYADAQWRGWLLSGIAFLVSLHIDWSKAVHKHFFGSVGLAILIITGIFGKEIGGARAWLAVGPIQFQPVEFYRVFFLLFVSRFLFDSHRQLAHRGSGSFWDIWGPLLIVLGGAFFLLAFQRDLGPALLFFLVFMTLMLAVSFSWVRLAGFVGLAAGGGLTGWFVFAHFRQRLAVWLNPWQYADTYGYQLLQGIFAFAAGGFIGRGISQGTAETVPQVHTDLTIVLIGEELGLLGAAMILAMYLCLIFWGLKIAGRQEGYLRILSLGISVMWGTQVFLVIGGVMRVIPLTGMTLPFLSYGTSSLITNMWLLGTLSSLERER